MKADGFFNLLRATMDLPIGTWVVFSSIAGRFGNAGQTDYSAANDLLGKLTSHLPRLRPGRPGPGPGLDRLDGIGMATRGSIPATMHQAGIDMLPPQAGLQALRRELPAGARPAEALVAGRLGMMAAEFDEAGGVDLGCVRRGVREGRPDGG